MTRAARPLEKCAERLQHRFRDPAILRHALTHASHSGARGDAPRDYERLEFLGDRVLGLIIAEFLFRHYPQADEGNLALRLNALVRKQTCAAVASTLDLGAYLFLGESEALSGGRRNATILANACEAVIAALYLDGGLETAASFVEREWAEYLAMVDVTAKDAKTALQEWAQARSLPRPVYEEIERSGPDHAPVFHMRAKVEGWPEAQGHGASKRSAEQEAAQAFLDKHSKTDGNQAP